MGAIVGRRALPYSLEAEDAAVPRPGRRKATAGDRPTSSVEEIVELMNGETIVMTLPERDPYSWLL